MGGRLLRAALLAGAALAVVALGAALLVWFIALSGLNEPVGFVYGGFSAQVSQWEEARFAHPLRLLAFALLAIVLASGWASSVPAHADEALLPDEADGAQGEVDDADPTDMGVAPIGAEPRGKTLSSALDAYLDQVFSSSGVPGAAVAVVDSDGVRYLRTLERSCRRCSADQTLIIGSLSKSMASAAVRAAAAGRGCILDAPVDDYLPAYRVPRSVTVRDLLNRTAGLRCYQSLADARVGESYGEFFLRQRQLRPAGKAGAGGRAWPVPRRLPAQEPLGPARHGRRLP